jgi:hypothetical protein
MKMVTLIGLLLSITLFSGCEKKYKFVSRDTNLTLTTEKEKELSRRYMDYWEVYSQKNFDESYKFELPYQNFIKGKEWYDNFFSTNNKNYKVIQKSIEFKDPDSAVIETQYIRKKNTHVFYDCWYYVNGTWYHKYKTSKLPNAEDD